MLQVSILTGVKTEYMTHVYANILFYECKETEMLKGGTSLIVWERANRSTTGVPQTTDAHGREYYSRREEELWPKKMHK